jgi:hypothetical protein
MSDRRQAFTHKPFIVRADEKLSVFIELESQSGWYSSPPVSYHFSLPCED